MAIALRTRQAVPDDAAQMVDLLNDIIALGGSTAHETPFDEAMMVHHYIHTPELISCAVAETEGQIVGFQFLAWPFSDSDPFPEGCVIIATFARVGMTGHGIGSALFKVTRDAAIKAGVKVIDATIRADNTGGLNYYSRMGFVDYDRLIGIPLNDGTKMDRIRKRLDL